MVGNQLLPPSSSVKKKPAAGSAASKVKKKPAAINIKNKPTAISSKKKPAAVIKKKPAASKEVLRLRRRAEQREARIEALRSAELERKRQNVKARALLAEKNKVTYTPRDSDLLEVAAQARAAQMMAKASSAAAQSANAKSDRASQEAKEAKSESREAKSESAAACQQVLQMHQRLGCVEALAEHNQERLNSVEVLAEHNQERLNTDDRVNGYSTPRRWRVASGEPATKIEGGRGQHSRLKVEAASGEASKQSGDKR